MFSHVCTYMCMRARICVRPLETRTKLVSRCGACQVAPSVCRDSMRAAARVRDPRRLRHDSPNSLRTAHVQTLTPDTASLSPGAYPSPLPSFFFFNYSAVSDALPSLAAPSYFLTSQTKLHRAEKAKGGNRCPAGRPCTYRGQPH